MKRHDEALAQFKRQKFLRVLLGSVGGVMLAHLLPMSESTVFIGLYPGVMLLKMDRFALKPLTKQCLIILSGSIAGALVIELFYNTPALAALITYGVFLTVLKLFSLGRIGNANSFAFTYSLSTIFASYAHSTMKFAATQEYFIQIVLVFLLVWGLFALFPAQMPLHRRLPRPPQPRPAGNGKLAVCALLCLAIWLFFMFFEWRVALFAFLSFLGSFSVFEREMLRKVARENMIIHVLSCASVAVLSMVLLGTGNAFLLAGGITLLLIPVVNLAVYPPSPGLGYRYRGMLTGVLVPLVLYLSTDRAALQQSTLRASLIILLMIILVSAIEFLHHGKESIRATTISIRKRRNYAKRQSDRPADLGSLPSPAGLSQQ